MRTEIAQIGSGESRLDDSLFSKDLAPHYMGLAGKLATSELVPKAFRGKPQDLFLCWAMGYQVGLSPEQSMQCIAVVNGKPTMWGDEMLALCMNHPEFEDIIEEPILKGEQTVGYRCTVMRKGRKPKSSEFTLEMAKRAGLLGKTGPWTQYPERMLKLRARGFALRDAFPDALKGIKSREEVEDYIDVEYKVFDKSRSDILKQELITKDEHVETTIEDKDLVSRDEVGISDVVPEPSAEPGNMDGERGREIESGDQATQVSAINPEQAKEIFRLIEEKGFSEERLQKAMKYYEVDALSKLTSEAADHFIKQLLKL